MAERSRTATIAAVDVGTNSVHMVIARADRAGLEVLASEKEVVRLGGGSRGMDHLAPEAIDRGVAALRHMKRIADSQGAVVRAVATSAVREADNGDEFVRRVRKETGIQVEVISGTEEARLIHLGVSRSLNLSGQSVLVVDIGGGSTEFCLAAKGKIRIVQSLKLGAVRMTDAYLPGGVVTDAGLRKLRQKVRSTFAPLAHDLARTGFDRVVLSSGTNETITRAVAVARGTQLPLTYNGFRFSAGELDEISRRILDSRTPQERLELPGIEAKRADIIAAGSVILHEIAKELSIENFEFSEYALREGVLIDSARRLGLLETDEIDAAHESVLRLAHRFSVDMDHSTHVAHLSRLLLKGVSRHFETDASLDRLLSAAALLANTGNAISYSRHHMHSYYIIRNAELLGFTDEEIEVIALAARYHRKSPPKQSHTEFAGLPEERQHDVALIAAILRIATGLDRSHDQSIKEISSSNKDGVLTFTVRHAGGSTDHVELNVQSAQSQTEMLAEYLGEDVLIVSGGPATR